jgi:hypothetical protein
MTKEELLSFLRENLRIELNSSDGSCYGSAGFEVTIYLGEDPISSSACGLPEDRKDCY